MSGIVRTKIVTNGLIFYLDVANVKSYISGSTTTTDLISNINGTLANDVRYNTDNLGNLSFDGVDDYINCTNNSLFDFSPGDAFSIESWVKFDDLTGPRFIVSKWARPTPTDLRAYTLQTLDNNFRFLFGSSNTSLIILKSTQALITGVWYHIVLTYDGSSDANGVKFYIDNNLSGKTIDRNDLTGVTTNTEPLQIGGQDAFFTSGQIANVKIYNREIFQNEVAQNYNALKNRFNI